MKDIPLIDRLVEGDRSIVAKDDFGNEITVKKVVESLCKILEQYGILQEDVVKSIWKNIQEMEISS